MRPLRPASDPDRPLARSLARAELRRIRARIDGALDADPGPGAETPARHGADRRSRGRCHTAGAAV